MWQANYDVVAITETWWDHFHDWSAATDVCKLFKRDSQVRRGGDMARYVSECFDITELGAGSKKVESLWVRIKGRGGPTRQIS